jgi:hypothetical protein
MIIYMLIFTSNLAYFCFLFSQVHNISALSEWDANQPTFQIQASIMFGSRTNGGLETAKLAARLELGAKTGICMQYTLKAAKPKGQPERTKSWCKTFPADSNNSCKAPSTMDFREPFQMASRRQDKKTLRSALSSLFFSSQWTTMLPFETILLKDSTRKHKLID